MTLLTAEVLLGDKDYLFLYAGGQEQFKYLTGEKSPSKESLINFVDNIKSRKEFCSKKNIQYVHVVYPSKPVVKKAFLPAPYKGSVKSLFNDKYLPQFNYKLPDYVLYPLEELLVADKETVDHNVYKIRDTHMTDFGYSIVVDQILKQLNLEYDFDQWMKCVDEGMIPELSRMSGDSQKYIERNIHYTGGGVSWYCNTKFLKGNTGNISFYHNFSAETGRNLLVFGDSFLKETLKFFLPLFENILYIRSSVFQKDIVDLFDPDVIITGNAERYLSQVESDLDASSILFYFDDKEWYKPDYSFNYGYQAQLSRKYYPQVYKKWSNSVKNSKLFFEGVGQGVPNGQVEVLDKKLYKMRSLGVDPYIEILGFPFEKGIFYRIKVNLLSTIKSTFVVYYLDRERNESYSEEFTVRQSINVGENFLDLKINSSNLLPRFRIDPMNAKGEFMIKSLEVVPYLYNDG